MSADGISISNGAAIPAMALDRSVTATRLEVFQLEIVSAWNKKAIAADQLSVTDEETLKIANRLAVELATAIKAVDARKDELCRPAKQFQDSVRGIAQGVEQPLAAAKKAIANKITIYIRDRDNRIAKERQEAQARLDEQARIERERQAAEAEMIRIKREQDAKELADLLGDIAAPAPAAEPPSSTVTTIVKAARLPDAPQVAKAAATIRKIKRLKIIDPSLIPYQIGGEILLEPQKAAIMRCMSAGASVPGCILEEVEETMIRVPASFSAEDPFA